MQPGLKSPFFTDDSISLRDQDRREVIYAKNLPRNSPASCLRELRTIFGTG
jgi:hypothetical protein